MIARREALKFAVSGLAGKIAARTGLGFVSAIAPASAAEQAPKAFALAEAVPFDPNAVTVAARTLSKQAFKPPADDLPDSLRTISYGQYASIRERTGTAIWSTDNIGFAIEPLH